MAGEPLSTYIYPLDITGTATTNRVPNEQQTLTPPPSGNDTGEFTFHFIIPFAAPFFRDTIKIKHIGLNRYLVPGTDYTYGHRFLSASFEVENVKGGLYTSIMFYNQTLSGQILIEQYQTLGGDWVLSTNKILEILSNRLVDPRTVSYEQVSGKPTIFPPIDHGHRVTDMTGYGELVLATYDVAAAIRERTADWLANPPLIMAEYMTADEIEAKFEEIGGGAVTVEDVEAMVTSMTTSYDEATRDLAEIPST